MVDGLSSHSPSSMGLVTEPPAAIVELDDARATGGVGEGVEKEVEGDGGVGKL